MMASPDSGKTDLFVRIQQHDAARSMAWYFNNAELFLSQINDLTAADAFRPGKMHGGRIQIIDKFPIGLLHPILGKHIGISVHNLLIEPLICWMHQNPAKPVIAEHMIHMAVCVDHKHRQWRQLPDQFPQIH